MAARAPEDGADARNQFARFERLGHVIVRTDFQPHDPVGRFAHGGEQDGRQFLRLDQVAGERQTVLARHHDVDQCEVRAVFAQQAARGGGAFRLQHHEPLADQIVDQGFAKAAFVIDEQQGCGRSVLGRGHGRYVTGSRARRGAARGVPAVRHASRRGRPGVPLPSPCRRRWYRYGRSGQARGPAFPAA